ncbi:tRNA pseudouridine synthase B [Arthrobacter alpinus]|uniref:tRNA pseudouridine synthase B n=1 Tax=Arthrobacter alpinus TaxID=656366 RepID=A0A0S2M1U5_9MICC|nr:tRNA pseudouridine(55) synthase TruB [Arthrobacter alpinus]ALO67585.1 tRNA pseudouridine synthase B [Arthrobacter alpinus]
MLSGLVIVDKPQGWTSHDVVGRMRRLAGTRKVGHAGTLDPMATGVLVVGINKATRLLTYIVGTSKRYEATIRLGVATVTDDAEGEVTHTASAHAVTDEAIEAGIAQLRGPIEQVPSSVSAIKVNGERAYARVRAGEDVKLASRPVTIHEFEVLDIRRGTHEAPAHVDGADTDGNDPAEIQTAEIQTDEIQTHDGVAWVDVDVTVSCSSGTYIRALARDLGSGLGVGGHLTALRRSGVGPYTLDQARTLEELASDLRILDIADAARALMPVRELTAEETIELSFGRRIPPSVDGNHTVEAPAAAFAPDGRLVALLADAGRYAKPVLVFPPDPAPAVVAPVPAAVPDASATTETSSEPNA